MSGITKQCKHCEIEKEFSDFYKHKNAKDGLDSSCKSCRKKKSKQCRQNNLGKRREYKKRYYHNNLEKERKRRRQDYHNSPEKSREKSRRYYHNNPRKHRESVRKWEQKNPTIKSYYTRKRQAQKLKAIPLWADGDKIRQIYENCPEGYEVDHIVPLQGKEVCGLHCENNLQYLTPEENMSKNNNLNEEETTIDITRVS